MIVERTGNLFTSHCPALGHGVNTLGSMGVGIALEFHRRWPAMYAAYRDECRSGRLQPRGIFVYQAPGHLIVNLGWYEGSRHQVQSSGCKVAAGTARCGTAVAGALFGVIQGMLNSLSGNRSWGTFMHCLEQPIAFRQCRRHHVCQWPSGSHGRWPDAGHRFWPIESPRMMLFSAWVATSRPF